MEVLTPTLNFGGLRGEVEEEENIVYYRRGFDELSLNITNACPNACVFCIRDRDAGWGSSNLYIAEDPSIDKILEELGRGISEVEASGVELEKVKICGYGEPILRFNDLFSIADYVRKRKDVDIQIATTGWPYFRFVDQDLEPLRNLKRRGVSHIYLSLNSVDNSGYKRVVRPGIEEIDEKAFADSLRFAETTRDAGYDVTLSFVKIGSLNELAAKDLAEKLGVKYRIRKFEV